MFVVFYCGPILSDDSYMGVSKNRDTAKWMVYDGNPHKNGWFGGTTILGNTHMFQSYRSVLSLFTPTGSPSVSWEKNGRKEPWPMWRSKKRSWEVGMCHTWKTIWTLGPFGWSFFLGTFWVIKWNTFFLQGSNLMQMYGYFWGIFRKKKSVFCLGW